MEEVKKDNAPESGGIDILKFDVVSKCETGHRFMLKNVDSTDSGVEVTILGRHADKVNKWINSVVAKAERDRQFANRRGKMAELPTQDEIKAQNIEGCIVRVVTWHGVTQTYSEDLMRHALKRNPHWVDQITNESDDLGNFT